MKRTSRIRLRTRKAKTRMKRTRIGNKKMTRTRMDKKWIDYDIEDKDS
jgi:KaiC/GvpD/RAD55 family RecA-like ATPase